MIKKVSFYILIALGFTAVSLIPFLHVLPSIKRYLYAFPGDPFWSAWFIWWKGLCRAHGLGWRFVPIIAYPFGLNYAGSPVYPVVDMMTGGFSRILNEIGAYNLTVFVSFPLSALAMFLLAEKITGDKFAAFFAGIIYAFCPYHTAHSLQHLTLSHIEWFPLFIYSVIVLDERKSVLFILFCAASLSLICLTDFYYAYFALFIALAFLLTRLFINGGFWKMILPLAVVFIAAGAITVVANYSMFAGLSGIGGKAAAGGGQFHRSMGDLLTFSAKPLDYLLPSKYNPFFGWLIPDLGLSPIKGHRFTEHTLYLGVIPMVLSVFALITPGRCKKLAIRFACVLAIMAGVLSLPPVIPLGKFSFDPVSRELIAAHKLYMPSYFLYGIVPFFRCYARFGLLVILGVSMLSAFSVSFINQKLKTAGGKVILTAGLSLAVFFEFMIIVPFMPVDAEKIPGEYLWLKDQKGDIVAAEYPMGDAADPFTVQEYLFYQRVHGKRLVNGAVRGTEAERFRKSIVDISKQETAASLKKAGVRYVLVHADKYRDGNRYVQMDWVTKAPRDKLFPPEYMDGKEPVISPDKGLKRVEKFGETTVYELE